MGSLWRIDQIPPATISFFSADLMFQQQCNLKYDDIETILRQLLLINDHVNIPTSFLLKSPFTEQLIKKHQLLLEEGLIVLAIDDNYANIHDYIEKYDLSSYPNRDKYKNDLDRLAEHARNFVLYTTQDMGSLSKEIFLCDFKEKFPRYYDSLFQRIGSSLVLDREAIVKWAQKGEIPTDRVSQIFESLNIAYVLGHQFHYQIQIESPKAIFPSMVKWIKSQNSVGDQVTDPEIADACLSVFSLDKSALSSLKVDDFMDFRKDSEIIKFRDAINTFRSTGMRTKYFKNVLDRSTADSLLASIMNNFTSPTNESRPANLVLYTSEIQANPDFIDNLNILGDISKLGLARFNASSTNLRVDVINDTNPPYQKITLNLSSRDPIQYNRILLQLLSAYLRRYRAEEIGLKDCFVSIYSVAVDAIVKYVEPTAWHAIKSLFRLIDESVEDVHDSILDKYFYVREDLNPVNSDEIAIIFIALLDDFTIFIPGNINRLSRKIEASGLSPLEINAMSSILNFFSSTASPRAENLDDDQILRYVLNKANQEIILRRSNFKSKPENLDQEELYACSVTARHEPTNSICLELSITHPVSVQCHLIAINTCSGFLPLMIPGLSCLRESLYYISLTGYREIQEENDVDQAVIKYELFARPLLKTLLNFQVFIAIQPPAQKEHIISKSVHINWLD